MNNDSIGTECVVCGINEQPSKGWIYKSEDIRPVEIDDGGTRFEAKEDASAYCSNECLQKAATNQEEQT